MAPLGENHCHFAAMLSRMIDLMHHLLPQGICPTFSFEILIFNHAREPGGFVPPVRNPAGTKPAGQVRLCAGSQELLRFAFNLIPAGADGVQRREPLSF